MFAFAAVILQRCFQATYPLNLSTRFLKKRKWKKEMNLFFATLLSSHSFSRTGFLKLFFLEDNFSTLVSRHPLSLSTGCAKFVFLKTKKLLEKGKTILHNCFQAPSVAGLGLVVMYV